MLVTETMTWSEKSTGRTPREKVRAGLVTFLDAVVRAVAGVGVVLVDRWVAGQLGLPTDELPSGGAGQTWPAAQAAREAGWEVREIHRWSRFRKGGCDVVIGLYDLMDPDYYPLKQEWPLDTAGALDAWQRLSGGMPYWGDPGDAVNALLTQLSACRMYGKPLVPAWRPKPVEAVAGQYARTFSRDGFERSMPGRWLVGYDATRAYLSAMTVVPVAPLPLKATGRRDFDPTQAGWWLVDLAPWTDERLPAPWGYYDEEEDRHGMVWLTTPDLVLLDQLRADGRYAGFTIMDSYTARGDRKVLRPVAERLREMWDAAAGLDNPQDKEAVRATIAAGYKACHGKWRSAHGDIRRPDWAAALVATARTNLWRRVDKGWPPAYVDGIDTVWYATDHPDQPPPGIVTERYPLNIGTARTDNLGTFRRKYLIDRQETQ